MTIQNLNPETPLALNGVVSSRREHQWEVTATTGKKEYAWKCKLCGYKKHLYWSGGYANEHTIYTHTVKKHEYYPRVEPACC